MPGEVTCRPSAICHTPRIIFWPYSPAGVGLALRIDRGGLLSVPLLTHVCGSQNLLARPLISARVHKSTRSITAGSFPQRPLLLRARAYYRRCCCTQEAEGALRRQRAGEGAGHLRVQKDTSRLRPDGSKGAGASTTTLSLSSPSRSPFSLPFRAHFPSCHPPWSRGHWVCR